MLLFPRVGAAVGGKSLISFVFASRAVHLPRQATALEILAQVEAMGYAPHNKVKSLQGRGVPVVK